HTLLQNIGVEPQQTNWKFERHSSLLNHPTNEYAYSDLSGLSGKATFATDIHISKELALYLSLMYGTPRVNNQPLFVRYKGGAAGQEMLNTTAIKNRLCLQAFLTCPPIIK